MSWLFPRLAADPACAAEASPRWGTVAAVMAAHVAILVAAGTLVPAGQLADLVQPLTVRLVEWQQEAPPQAAAEPPRPMPVKPQRPVVLASAAPLTAGQPVVSEVVSIPSAVPPALTFVAPPLVEARFDAAYLNNPKPVYPAASRRLGEEGRVVLRVQVNAEGQADAVDIKASSGFPRLDAAAREAVARWRFVPARRGETAVPSAVLVPVVFNLES